MKKEEIRKILEGTDEKTSVRLNKYLSDAGVCSRREADRLIEAGVVFLDGKPAVLGDQVQNGQKVFVNGKEISPKTGVVLLALNKPEGIECTTDPKNPDNIVDFVHYPERVYPVGRLDKNSSGLILLTNTGELVNKILKASNHHEKEYLVEVDRDLSADFPERMGGGVKIHIENEGRTVTTRKCRVEKTGKRSFSIVLTQGYNRQIRRMCRALGYEVKKLKRIRIMSLSLDDLPKGKYREVTETELKQLLKEL